MKNDTKKERIKGIISIILWIGLMIIIQSLLVFLFKDIMKLEGTPNEELFRNLSTYIPLAIITFVFIVRYFKNLKEDIKRLTKKNIIFILIMAIVAIAITIVIDGILDFFGVNFNNQEQIEEMLTSAIIPTILMALIYGPIVEELVFRKALNQIITNKYIFIILSALLFGLIHEVNLAIIDYIVAGALFAFVYLKTNKNIVASISVHFINNLIGVIVLFISF